MFDDIGKEARQMASEMLDVMEGYLCELKVRNYHKDARQGMITVYPKAAEGMIRIIEIIPLPLAGSVEVRAISTDNRKMYRCRFRWKKNCRKELSLAVRKVITGG